jgi:hypothetical protein
MATATAVKKTIPIKTVAGKKPGTALALWEQEMAAAAKKQSASEKPMGSFKQVAVNGGVMVIDEKNVPGNKLRCVVLAATHENQWYDKPYNPAVPSVPKCFAFGDQTLDDPEAEMVPHADSDERQGHPDGEDQGGADAKCSECWANRMGTADVGKGKACKNIRRLILTTEDALESPEAMKNAEARMFKIPVMSVSNWVNFVHECDEEFKRTYWGVVVEIGVVPDPKSQWKITFTFQELISFDQDLYDATKKRVASAAKDILAPYPKLDEAPPPPARGGRGAPVKSSGKAPSGPTSRKGGKF